jgi:serine/threonine protein kinase
MESDSLTPERLLQAQALWEATVALPTGDRMAFLASTAQHDPDLQQFVLELLAAHESTGDIFSRPLSEQLGLVQALPSVSLTGRTLGAYRVVAEVGHGGMGSVYEAVRADDQFTKRVAIKTLRIGTASEDMARRFVLERHIHAALAHPNIAMLLDAGITEDGIPYIVLEYVDGLPIDEYCARHRLGLRARLDLFRQVIHAVDHAHRRLIVHRDLKPSNILVAEGGVVKLLDFGISKLISDAVDHQDTHGPRAFTTAYASPEQISGAPISTATDVYSLGVVLYGLLAGRHPFDIQDSSPAEAWATIVTEPTPAPSAVATADAAAAMEYGTAPRLRRALRGELDAIVLMALRKEPERRYRSADAMGDDIQRHLRGLAVRARPDSAGYRLRKLVGRNRLATAASALAVVAMVGGTMASVSLARRARAEQVVADRERRTAERVAAFLQDILASPDPSYSGRGLGPGATLGDAVDLAARRIDSELAGEPEVALALHRVLSGMYTQSRQTQKGAHHARRQVELLRELGTSGPALAKGLHDLGSMLRNAGHPDSAVVVLREAYRAIEQAGFPAVPEVAVTLNELGLSLWATGNPREAAVHLRHSIEINTRIPGSDIATAISSSNLGNTLFAIGDLEGAERAYRQAGEMLSRANRNESLEYGAFLNNLTTVLILTSDFDEAERTIRQGLAILERTLGPRNERIAISTIHLARIELATGRASQALETIRGAAAMLGHLPPRHPERARAETYEAAILHALGRLQEAEPLARRALDTRRQVGAPTDWRIGETAAVMGRILLARGRSEEAVSLMEEAHAILSGSMGDDHPLTKEVANDLSLVPRSPRSK